MELLALDDPIFVIELTPAALERCRQELAGEAAGPHVRPPAREGAGQRPAARRSGATKIKERPIRAIALIVEEEGDPLLLSIEPTRDVEGLDAAARLVRAAVVTGCSVAELATDFGDARLRELYFRRRLPAFIYEGISAELARQLPPRVRTTLAGPRRGASE